MKVGQSVFNIYDIKVNSMADNASINVGHNVMKEFSVENKNQGVNSTIGDYSNAKSIMGNTLNENNKKDQSSQK